MISHITPLFTILYSIPGLFQVPQNNTGNNFGVLLFLLFIGAAVLFWHLFMKDRESGIKKKDSTTPFSMDFFPVIYAIQPSDAPQHTGKLQEILQILKSENRIRDFTKLSTNEDLSSFTDLIKDEDLILLVLSHQLHSEKEQIDNLVRALKAEAPGVRIGEIIIDNVPYENDFITFPADLTPVRERNDMDAVWSDIHQSLKDMLPVLENRQTVSEPHTTGWKKYLKIGKAVIIYIVLVFALFTVLFMLIAKLLGDASQDLVIPLLIITFIAAMVASFFLTRKMYLKQQSKKSD